MQTFRAVSLFIAALTGVTTALGQAWSYKGIPYTDWAYDPFTIEPTLPSSWTDPTPSATAGYYYVEPSNPAATDSGNAYGHPDLPRATIPATAAFGNTFAAGTIIYLKGPGFGQTQFGGLSQWNPTFSGTSGNPCWIIGDSGDPPIIDGFTRMLFVDTRYLVIDGLHYDGSTGAGNDENTVLSMSRSDRFYDTDHVTVRNCRFENLDYISGGAGIITINGPTGYWCHNIVAYNNIFKGCGGGFDWTASDGDQHGIHPGSRAYRVWAINNEVIPGDTADGIDGVYKGVSGNLMQVGGNTNVRADLHHIYAAGNKALNGGLRQALLWTKNCAYVIFSENYCDRNGDYFSADNGQSFGSQYDAEHHWFIFNTAVDARAGWMHTDNGSPRTGPHVIYGNVFKNINSQGLNAVNSFDRGIVSLWNNQNDHYIVNNTAYNVESGVNINGTIPGGVTMTIKNNLLDELQGGEQRFFGIGNSSGTLDIDNNLLHTSGTWEAYVGGTTYSSLASMNARGDCDANLDGDPLLIDPPSDVQIPTGSPAKDAGTSSTDIPALFFTTFDGDPDYPGTPNIEYDFISGERIFNLLVDIGAYEFGATPGGSAPVAPSGLSANAVTSSRIDLSWTDNSDDELQFRIEQSTTSGSGFSEIATPAANATSYSVTTGLSPATTYYFRVRASNGYGNSSYTSEASATTDSESQPSGRGRRMQRIGIGGFGFW